MSRQAWLVAMCFWNPYYIAIYDNGMFSEKLQKSVICETFENYGETSLYRNRSIVAWVCFISFFVKRYDFSKWAVFREYAIKEGKFKKSIVSMARWCFRQLRENKQKCQYVCRCDCRYVGRTFQRLQDRIIQRISRCIRSDKRPTKNLPNWECIITSTPSVYCDSAIKAFTRKWRMCKTLYRCTIFHFV